MKTSTLFAAAFAFAGTAVAASSQPAQPEIGETGVMSIPEGTSLGTGALPAITSSRLVTRPARTTSAATAPTSDSASSSSDDSSSDSFASETDSSSRAATKAASKTGTPTAVPTNAAGHNQAAGVLAAAGLAAALFV
ncbi:hypothetical protein CDD83_11102 [Cordyceps sp. RAO-2017]|nr:hypothetical protein CDD83_11102 [Cordyceps sp. RAO-2017]